MGKPTSFELGLGDLEVAAKIGWGLSCVRKREGDLEEVSTTSFELGLGDLEVATKIGWGLNCVRKREGDPYEVTNIYSYYTGGSS